MTDQKDKFLNADDRILWQAVSDGIEPLKDQNTAFISDTMADFVTVKSISENAPISNTTQRATKSLGVNKTDTTRHQPNAKSDKSLDRQTDRRLRQGKIEIDKTLDMHGMRQEVAHSALRRVLTDAYRQNDRLVLVITGKGQRSNVAGGILRKRLFEWCDMAPLHDIVLKIAQSRPQHGGSGAFYVYLRRNRNA